VLRMAGVDPPPAMTGSSLLEDGGARRKA